MINLLSSLDEVQAWLRSMAILLCIKFCNGKKIGSSSVLKEMLLVLTWLYL